MLTLIRRTFRESGMSIKRLSGESGVAYGCLYPFITGVRNPQLRTVERVCRVLRLELRLVGRRVKESKA